MTDPIEQLEAGLAARRWVQDAACRLLANGALSSQDFDELTLLCKAEAGVPLPKGQRIPEHQVLQPGSLRLVDTGVSVRMEAVGAIKGVNALSPRKPLEFGNKQLCVVFGNNGSGKSGYVRLLKHLCGCRRARLPLGNVFEDRPTEPSCEVRYTLDGIPKSADCKLNSGALADLAGVSIYDTECAQVYVNEKNEITCEPPLLRLLRELVQACDKVSEKLGSEIRGSISALPSLPPELANTEAGRWYSSLSRETTEATIDEKCTWRPEDEAGLEALAGRIGQVSPAQQAGKLRKTREHALELVAKIKRDREAYSDAAFEALKRTKQEAEIKRRVAKEDATKVFQNVLDGIASESWRQLWSAARRYSDLAAYPEQKFPFVGDDARCVLCQQPLVGDSAARMQGFERYVKGELEASATTAETALSDTIKNLPPIVAEDDLAKQLDLASVDDPPLRTEVQTFYRELAKRKEAFFTATGSDELPELPGLEVVDKLEVLASRLEVRAAELDKDARADQRIDLERQLAEAKARQRLSEQRLHIVAEVHRLKHQHLLEVAQGSAKTYWLTNAKTKLATVMSVSERFIEGFQRELVALRAGRIKVAIERTKSGKAQVLHQIKLVNAKADARTSDVLSEGEFRIVSLAAFFADVESRTSKSTFVFDDPVSSLDQEFEEATARRLVALSKQRQVIVFTHRPSMLSLLESAAKEDGTDPCFITLRREEWGAGEPGRGPIRNMHPEKAVNALRGEYLSRARKAKEEQGQEAYESIAKALCSELRITLERFVESVLLDGIVERFRREVRTKNKLMHLSRIDVSDCRLIEDLMTKYSFQEHSQPQESPGLVLGPDEIEADLKSLTDWYQDFEKRKKSEDGVS